MSERKIAPSIKDIYEVNFIETEIGVYNNPFCRMIDFGHIPPERIFATTSSTPVTEQDHPDLLVARDKIMTQKQEEINRRAAQNNTEPFKLWDGGLPRVEQIIAIPDEMALLVLGETTFFRHVAYTEKQIYPLDGPVEFPANQKTIGNAWMETTTPHNPNPLGAAMFIAIEKGETLMIGTPLVQTDERFQLKAVPSGYSHLRADKGKGRVQATVTALREMVEETGFQTWEIEDLNLVGRPFERLLGKGAVTLVYTSLSELSRAEVLKRPREQKDMPLFVPNRQDAFKEVMKFAPISQCYLPGGLLTIARYQWGEKFAIELNQDLNSIGKDFLSLSEDEAEEVALEMASQLRPENIGKTVFETQ
ncbi:hypothetical protein A2714_02895 [Candidatus Woesebacteria bacterium RIFCSPHIGHO2_01_FULL_38_9]|uniref:Nudix hydrolase domain-containing protein n=2 Tax=Candidatus Woeseibacteriota TaxID=1752722 RepID=A0A1F7XY56_9BACT|nr:MAG: hypothetical protein A2714_02895 [Candidatus Woesebacteria bacterium RIFCSPHIGHO2_01_FULL_38_9]OGM60588.1 MAG: hypothetical protein A3A75_03645 [Candidatus Woesebacteria bacterium RIFCSPLOWO2_01_FULL_39_10]